MLRLWTLTLAALQLRIPGSAQVGDEPSLTLEEGTLSVGADVATISKWVRRD